MSKKNIKYFSIIFIFLTSGMLFFMNISATYAISQAWDPKEQPIYDLGPAILIFIFLLIIGIVVGIILRFIYKTYKKKKQGEAWDDAYMREGNVGGF